jgi:hypothetical protein
MMANDRDVALSEAQLWAERAAHTAKKWPNLASTDYPHLRSAIDMANMWAGIALATPAAHGPPRPGPEVL